MKHTLVAFALCVIAVTTSEAQSKSFATLRHHFGGEHEVHTFSVNGFFVNLVLSVSDDETFNRKAIRDVDRVSVMTIPREHFARKNLSVNGFVKYAQSKDGFQELLCVKESGSNVRVLMKDMKRKHHQYLMLVEEDDDVVAVEFKGYIDMDQLYKSL